MTNLKAVLAYAIPSFTALLTLLWFFGRKKDDEKEKITKRVVREQTSKQLDNSTSKEPVPETANEETEVMVINPVSVDKIESLKSQLTEGSNEFVLEQTSSENLSSTPPIENKSVSSEIKSHEQTALAQDVMLSKPDSKDNFLSRVNEEDISNQILCTNLPKNTSEYMTVRMSEKSYAVDCDSDTIKKMSTSAKSRGVDISSKTVEVTCNSSHNSAQDNIHSKSGLINEETTSIETYELSANSKVPITQNQNSSLSNAANIDTSNLTMNNSGDLKNKISKPLQCDEPSLTAFTTDLASRCNEKIDDTLEIKSHTTVSKQPISTNKPIISDEHDVDTSNSKPEVISPFLDDSTNSEQNNFDQSATDSNSKDLDHEQNMSSSSETSTVKCSDDLMTEFESPNVKGKTNESDLVTLSSADNVSESVNSNNSGSHVSKQQTVPLIRSRESELQSEDVSAVNMPSCNNDTVELPTNNAGNSLSNNTDNVLSCEISTGMSKLDEKDESQENDNADNVHHISPRSEHTGDSPSIQQSSDSPSCDNNSEASNDSGRGGSVTEPIVPPQMSENHIMRYEINFPSELCGRLIGKFGKNINYLKEVSGAYVSLKNNPYTPDFQICLIEGKQAEVDKALASIRKKFPRNQFPQVDLTPLGQQQPAEIPLLMPDIMQLSLPESVSVDIVISSIVDAGHIFVQQPTHPTFPSLERLNHFMMACYSQNQLVPGLPRPIEVGVICACFSGDGWYRAQIMSMIDESDECDVKYVDYGGYARMQASALKQIRSDFMTLPFQAVECYMGNITPLQDEEYFSDQASTILQEITQGKVLQAQVINRAEDGLPYIHIYRVGENRVLFINREMVNHRVVRWIEILQ